MYVAGGISMRIALISNVHANAVALSSVLKHVEEEGADPIECLGDVATLESPRCWPVATPISRCCVSTGGC